jgi:dTDP-glucose 4,6-dehydratase
LKVLVTGGAGFIGSNFVRLVLSNSETSIQAITVLDKLTYAGTLTNLTGLPKDAFEFIQGDICDQSLVRELGKRHDVIINFAAESHVDRSINSARDFMTTNIVGAQTLLETLRFGTVQTIIQVSTDEVYGSIENGSWDENFPLNPNSPYAATKASADLIARSYSKTYGVDVRITRCSNNYGPNQFPEKIIPLFITSLMDNKKIPLYGNGQNYREWLHVEDHCRAILKVLTNGKSGEIYNIGGGTELSNKDLTMKILNLMNKDESCIEYVEDRLGHDFRYSVNSRKILDQLGFTPKINFENGILDTINWYLNNENWWRSLKSP